MSASAPSASITFGPITVLELAPGVSARVIEGSAAASTDKSSAVERINAESGLESAFMANLAVINTTHGHACKDSPVIAGHQTAEG